MQNTECPDAQGIETEIRELSLTEAAHVSGSEIVTGSGVRLVNDGGTGSAADKNLISPVSFHLSAL